MRAIRHFASYGALLLLASGAYADDAALAHGAELLSPFKMNLKSALVEGIQQGPAEAISACREQAPEIAESMSVDGVTVGRSSHRLRNAHNVAPAWAARVSASRGSAAWERSSWS